MGDNLPASGAQPSPAAQRLVWTIIVGALVAAVPIYGIVGWMLLRNAPPVPQPADATMIWAMRAMAAAVLAASVLSLRLAPRRMIPAPASTGGEIEPPLSITNRSIVSMAFAEGCTVIGFVSCFFLRHAPLEYPWYAAGTLLVQLLLVIPDGARAWDAWQESAARGV